MKAFFLIYTALILASPPALHAFGKNKVQYQRMRWEYLQAEHFTLYFHQNQGALPEISYIWIDDIYSSLSSRFGYTHSRRVPIVLYESPALFEQTNIISEILPEEVGGFTEIFKNRVALPFNGCWSDLRHILHHEMQHAFIFGIMLDGSVFRAASSHVPLWFNEGLSEVLSTGWTRDADMYMLDRVLLGNVPPPGPALDGFLAYKGGQSFFYYLHSIGGDSLFNRMLREFNRTKQPERSIEAIYEKSLEELGRSWLNELRRIYWPEIGRRLLPSDHAAPVTVNTRDRSRFNMRPKISPCGELIAFYSDRKDYTRIIITDTSGKLQRAIGQHRLSGSFESFQPLSGAMAWSPDGSELAFIAKKGGRNDIRIVNARTGRQRKTVNLPLSAITGLDWSRDGGRLALTAISYGQTDLFLYDLNTLELRALTNSPESKTAPRFSPNGKKILFATTDTVGLRNDPLTQTPWKNPRPTSNIAMFDLETNRASLLTNTMWNDKQPAFSPDGKHFVFVSDRNGIDNLYIARMDDPGNPRPLTDYTGSAGNPDWAADGSAIVYDNFLGQAWNIWRMTNPMKKILGDSALAKTRWAEYEEGASQEFFRNPNRKIYATDDNDGDDNGNGDDTNKNTDADISTAPHTEGVQHLASPANDTVSANNNVTYDDTVHPSPDTIPVPSPYTLRFTPDFLIFGLGISTYSGASGQAMASFSDIMGDHRIVLAGDLQMDFTDYARIFLAYQYLKMRTDITVGSFYNRYYSYDGFFRRHFHDLETGGFLGAGYPFSRFSRVNADLFVRHMQRTPITGDDKTVLEHNALQTNFAYTFDNILWGITGPLRGLRGQARIYLAPPLDLTDEAYLSGDIDLRHYTHINRKYVWANRVTAGGTIGLDGKSAARRFFLGGTENWFNYAVNRTEYDDNLEYSYYSSIVTPLRGWDYFDVTGDRMLLMNSEFRFPFIREISTVWPLPMRIRFINGALFMDAGYAWTRKEQTEKHLPLPPKLLGGYGFGMRANLGIFVLRYDRGWPTDWHTIGRPTNYYSLGAEF